MLRTTILISFLAVAVLAGCAPAAESMAQPAPAADTGWAAAKRTWEARRPAAYAYTLGVSCFCIHRGEYAVQVRDGRIVSVRDAATGAPADESRAQWIVTVDALFDQIRQAAERGTSLRVQYHPELGYPTEAEIGTLANDSGTLYRIENLRAL